MAEPESPFGVQSQVRAPWRRYLDALAPLRPDLHRYCCRLAGNVWDGEDLAQDTLVRVFSLLGKIDVDLEEPRAYLIRTATNLWIDRTRRRSRERAFAETERRDADTVENPHAAGEGAEIRDAAEALLQRLAPQERAAVLLKDVFDLSLEETASVLKTTPGAVKSALHRGRGRLDAVDRDTPIEGPHRVDGINEVHRIEESDGRITRIRCYCFCPDTLRLLGEHLALPALARPYRSPSG